MMPSSRISRIACFFRINRIFIPVENNESSSQSGRVCIKTNSLIAIRIDWQITSLNRVLKALERFENKHLRHIKAFSAARLSDRLCPLTNLIPDLTLMQQYVKH
jgi:hypothetical protein